MKKIVVFSAVVLVLGSMEVRAQFPPAGDVGGRRPGRAFAQNAPGEGRRDRQLRPEAPRPPGLGRALEENMFPPELVMRNQQAIGLRDEQQEAIRVEMQKAMARFTDLQWQQSALVETLETSCGNQHLDEKAVLAQFDKLLAVEGEIKRLHFASLVKVKNILSPEQQARLRELERQARPRPDDQQRRMPGNPGPGGPPLR